MADLYLEVINLC